MAPVAHLESALLPTPAHVPLGSPSKAMAGLLTLALFVLSASSPSSAEESAFLPTADAPVTDGLSGDDLYQRVLDNRFDAYDQDLQVVSGDGAGHFSSVELHMKYLNFRSRSKRVISKTIAKYSAPPDVRHLGYLVINKQKGPDDQFVYRPSSRKVRRVNVRSEAVAGTDFSFEDVVPPEFDDGRHYRMADDEISGTPVYVVTVIPHAETESQYSKVLISVEKEHFVPIRTLYWDNKELLIKQLDAETGSLESFEGVATEGEEPRTVWIARRARMSQKKTGHFSTLDIQRFEANPKLRERDFSQRELTASH